MAREIPQVFVDEKWENVTQVYILPICENGIASTSSSCKYPFDRSTMAPSTLVESVLGQCFALSRGDPAEVRIQLTSDFVIIQGSDAVIGFRSNRDPVSRVLPMSTLDEVRSIFPMLPLSFPPVSVPPPTPPYTLNLADTSLRRAALETAYAEKFQWLHCDYAPLEADDETISHLEYAAVSSSHPCFFTVFNTGKMRTKIRL